MMNIMKEYNEKELTLSVQGRIDTITSQELEVQLKRAIDQKKSSSELLKQYEGLIPKAQEQER